MAERDHGGRRTAEDDGDMNRIRKEAPCPGCGKTVLYIKCVNRRTVIADPEPVSIRPDIHGEEFITEDGRLFWGEIAGDAYDQPGGGLLECYVMHKGHCPGGGRKRRRK